MVPSPSDRMPVGLDPGVGAGGVGISYVSVDGRPEDAFASSAMIGMGSGGAKGPMVGGHPQVGHGHHGVGVPNSGGIPMGDMEGLFHHGDVGPAGGPPPPQPVDQQQQPQTKGGRKRKASGGGGSVNQGQVVQMVGMQQQMGRGGDGGVVYDQPGMTGSGGMNDVSPNSRSKKAADGLHKGQGIILRYNNEDVAKARIVSCERWVGL